MSKKTKKPDASGHPAPKRGKKPAQDELDNFDSALSDLPPWDSTSKSRGTPLYPRCHDKHPELAIGGGVLVGASCNHPRPDFDVYVGFDYGMKIAALAPWLPATVKGPIQGKFEITDMQAPKDPAEFALMLDWLIEQLAAGRRVHIGCIGGHGRTGLVLSALVAKLGLDEDPIAYVRQVHCKKAVESQAQVDWLVKHYGCKPATPQKATSWSQKSFDGKYNGIGASFEKDPLAPSSPMGMLGKSGEGKALKGGPITKGGSLLGEGLRLTPLDGPSRIFDLA